MQLHKFLVPEDYYKLAHMTGLCRHVTRSIQFTLVVGDFEVKYTSKEHALHLKKALEADYTVTTEWEGKRYIGITLD